MRYREHDDEHFMREALAEARLAANEGEVPIGAVVVCGAHVVARAHNRRETDADPSAHAEFAAMVAAARALGRWRLTGCTVYVTLEPCLMCAGLMVNARIDRCVYGAADPKGGAVGTLYDVSADSRLNHSFEVTAGVLAEECARELRGFFAGLRGAKGDGAGTGAHCVRHGEEDLGAAVATAPCGRPADGDIVLAVDSFKGSATSTEAEAWLEEGIRRALPGAHISSLPIADGGEGTLGAVGSLCGGSLRELAVTGPLRGVVQARYLQEDRDPSGEPAGAAFIECAQAAGIGLSPLTHPAALDATSFGVGELILDAAGRGARTVYVGLGGSAVSDGGAGMLQALGARLEDRMGAPVGPGLRGLRDIASIDLAPARAALHGVGLVALTDVTAPLAGPRGAVRVFASQKGLGSGLPAAEREEAFAACDSWMAAYASLLTAARDALDGGDLQVGRPGKRPRSIAGVPGAGAAGGLGAALLALGARLTPGVEAVLDLARFDDLARHASLIVTGEGSLDAQTAAGKAPAGVARRAKAVNPNVLVVAVCGGRAEDLDAAYASGIDIALPISREPMPLERALTHEETRRNLVCAGETCARILLSRR